MRLKVRFDNFQRDRFLPEEINRNASTSDDRSSTSNLLEPTAEGLDKLLLSTKGSLDNILILMERTSRDTIEDFLVIFFA